MPRLHLILPLLLLPFALGAQDSLTISGHVTTGEAATAITTTTTGMPDVVVTEEGIN